MLRSFAQHPNRLMMAEMLGFWASKRDPRMAAWNRTEMDFPSDKCVQELFEHQVHENPDAEAVAFQNSTWTYRQLNARANGVARCLRKAGINPGSMVGICVERSAEVAAVILGVWKAACAYVSLDPHYPADLINNICADGRLSVIITNKTFELPVSGLNLRLLFVEDIGDDFGSRANAQPASYPEDLAYVVYTSRSTAKLAGVQIRHRSVVNLLTTMARVIDFTKRDHLAAVTAITRDMAVVEFFLPLTTGGKLTVVERNVIGDGIKLAKLIDDRNVTVMQATPTVWASLLQSGWRGTSQLNAICGGEALSPHLTVELQRRAKSAWNFYGAPEVSVYCTGWKIEPGKPISIGRPLGNMQAYILHKDRQPVPVGVVGELHIGGEGLAAGYLNRPELTAEKFIANPFESGRVIYNTGDLARYLPDGTIQWLGPSDVVSSDRIKLTRARE